MNFRSFFIVLSLLTFLSARPGVAQPLGFSSNMQQLCAAADGDFSPKVDALTYPNKDPLFRAIELGSDSKETQKLLQGKHPDSFLILEDITPLMYAAMSGNWRGALGLLEKGANINYRSLSTGSSVLSIATYAAQFPFACKLIQHGAKIPSSNEERFELLQSVIPMSSHDPERGAIFLDHLLSIGFDANDHGSAWNTPLMGAVSLHNIPVIKVLLKHGARLDIVKQDGRTVWTVAKEKNNPQVLKLLKEAQKKAKPQKRQPAALVPATV